MAEVDADLVAALKLAKSKKLFFAFIPKGSDGKLILSKKKIPPKEIADAKKELGGSNPIIGKCFGPIGNMVFQVVKQPPPTLEAALKKVAKRDSGLTVIPNVQLAADAEAEEPDAGAPAAGGAPATPAKEVAVDAAAPAPGATEAPGKSAPPAAGGQGNVTGIQKLLQKLGYDPGKIDGIMGPHTKEAIKKFQKASGMPADGNLNPATQAALAKALKGGAGGADGAAAAGGADASGASAGGAPAAPQAQQPALDASSKDAATLDYGYWENARKNAITDLKALAAKIAGAAKTAGTKPADAGGVLKEINAIIAMLPPKPVPQEIDKLVAIIRQDDAITAAEECPKHFHEVNIRKPLLAALDGLKK